MTFASSPLRVVIGPTAAGKSAIAMTVAEARGLAIVSADSRQVYRGFDVGTAKPTAADRARVPHYGIDVVEPTVRYSAHAWAADATRWLDEAQAGGASPLVVGGTGFYVRALVAPLDAVPALDPARRERLERFLGTLDGGTLARWCRRLDPARASLGRTQQLRAIETALLAGVRLGDVLGRGDDASREPAPVRRTRYLVVDPGPVLATRIAKRVEGMLAAGWLDEVERLVATVPADAPAWKASGYGTLREHLEGRLSRAAAVAKVIVETRQYAKRQRTWCRHQLGDGIVTHLDPDRPDAVEQALAWWDSGEEEGS